MVSCYHCDVVVDIISAERTMYVSPLCSFTVKERWFSFRVLRQDECNFGSRLMFRSTFRNRFYFFALLNEKSEMFLKYGLHSWVSELSLILMNSRE